MKQQSQEPLDPVDMRVFARLGKIIKDNAVPVLICVIFYAYTAYLREEIAKQLTGYVTKAEHEAHSNAIKYDINTWRTSHVAISDEVMRRLDQTLNDLKDKIDGMDAVARANAMMLSELKGKAATWHNEKQKSGE